MQLQGPGAEQVEKGEERGPGLGAWVRMGRGAAGGDPRDRAPWDTGSECLPGAAGPLNPVCVRMTLPENTARTHR